MSRISLKRLHAVHFFLMTETQKKQVINQLPSDIAAQLMSYYEELSNIIPRYLSAKEKELILVRVLETKELVDDSWERFSNLVLQRMSNLNIYPEKLKHALIKD